MTVQLTASQQQAYDNCPTSHHVAPRLNELKYDRTLEGNDMHEYARILNTGFAKFVGFNNVSPYTVNDLHYMKKTFLAESIFVNERFKNRVGEYTKYCQNLINEVRQRSPQQNTGVYVEYSVETFLGTKGIVDFAIINGNCLEVVDLKTGAHKEYAKNNSQLYTYADALLKEVQKLALITSVKVTIFQPESGADSVMLTLADIEAWKHEQGRHLNSRDMNVAHKQKHCHICRLGVTCSHYVKEFIEAEGIILSTDIQSATGEDFDRILYAIKIAEKFIEQFKKEAPAVALARELDIPNHVLISGQRRLYSHDTAVDYIAEHYPEYLDVIAPRKLLASNNLKNALLAIGSDKYDEIHNNLLNNNHTYYKKTANRFVNKNDKDAVYAMY